MGDDPQRRAQPGDVAPNMADYGRESSSFSWDAARRALDGLPGGRGLNIAHEAVDRHAAGPAARPRRPAMRRPRRRAPRPDLRRAGRALEPVRRRPRPPGRRAREPGSYVLLPRVPDLYVAVLGTLKHRSVLCPLFSAFGPEPIRQRLHLGRGSVLVTTEPLYRRKVAEDPGPPPRPAPRAHRRRLDDAAATPAPRRAHSALDALLEAGRPGLRDRRRPTRRTWRCSTSRAGRPGTPKGAVHVHEAVVSHHATGRIALDLHPDDVFWCTADPGWVTGTSYGIVSPLVHGVTEHRRRGRLRRRALVRDARGRGRHRLVHRADRAADARWPAGPEAAERHDLRRLRFVASVGEPLNPEVVVWGQEVLGLPDPRQLVADRDRRDHDRQLRQRGHPARVDGPAAARDRGDDPRARRARRGRRRRRRHGRSRRRRARRASWPCGRAGRRCSGAISTTTSGTGRASPAGWYLSGDLARRDGDGYFWFVGRGDDVIKSAGHLIGPFEVESTLMEHPAVAEAGVIGKPDPVAGEVVKAFVSLRVGHRGQRRAAPRADRLLPRTRLGAAVAPREIEFADRLPAHPERQDPPAPAQGQGARARRGRHSTLEAVP